MFSMIVDQASCVVGNRFRQSVYLLKVSSNVQVLSFLTATAYIPLPPYASLKVL